MADLYEVLLVDGDQRWHAGFLVDDETETDVLLRSGRSVPVFASRAGLEHHAQEAGLPLSDDLPDEVDLDLGGWLTTGSPQPDASEVSELWHLLYDDPDAGPSLSSRGARRGVRRPRRGGAGLVRRARRDGPPRAGAGRPAPAVGAARVLGSPLVTLVDARPASALRRLPAGLAVATVLLQVAYPLVDGTARDRLTVVTVLAFFAASTTHALLHRGARWTALLVLVTAGTGLLAESVGTSTGVPFGEYDYAGSLGPKLLSVPVVIPLAWTMMAYPCLLVGQRLARTPVGAAVVGGWALAAWDLFLDPQMVEAGHWTWADVELSLPGSPDIPVSNHLGWLLVAVLMLGLLQLLPRRDADDRVPAALFLWTYASSVLAFAVFFGRPVVALVGGVGMGLVAVPYARALRR